MKNIFKFMGIALMACSLTMVSCGKDDENNDNPDNPVTPVTPSGDAVIDVTFGNTQWSADANSEALLYTGYVSEYNMLYTRVFKTPSQYPFFSLLCTITPGTYEAEATLGTAEDENGEYTYYSMQDQNIMELYYCETNFFQNGTSQSGQAQYTGDWHPVTAKLTIGAFDANALNATFTVESKMYDYYNWYYGNVVNAEDADTKTFKAVVNNYTFSNWE